MRIRIPMTQKMHTVLLNHILWITGCKQKNGRRSTIINYYNRLFKVRMIWFPYESTNEGLNANPELMTLASDKLT